LKLEFYGAAEEVTGSCHLLEVGGHRVLLDCGMIQGGSRNEKRNRDSFPFAAQDIDAVVLSHAHIDHSGRLPLLVKRGYQGPIHSHGVSAELAQILLQDSAQIAASAARHANKARTRRGEAPIEPLYTREDAAAALHRFQSHRYGVPARMLPGVTLTLYDAGHIMGSAVVHLALEENGVQRSVVFSGDLGQFDTPILRDPVTPPNADLVLMESTYGDRNHRDRAHTLEELERVLRDTQAEGGNIVIPAFAVGRSQEILYQLGKHYDAWGLADWQVVLDSPLAIRTSEIYWDNPHLYDAEATTLRAEVDPMPLLRNLRLCRTADESRALNKVRGGLIIIAGSGMLNGGRVLHHLKRLLPKPSTRLLFTGFQPPNSLGRRLIHGQRRVRIHGRPVDVAAQVHTIGGMSAHGDQRDLLRWYRGFDRRPPVYLVHGDRDAARAMRRQIVNETGASAHVARRGTVIDLERLKPAR
jgi:metallo-beta-lactamase family protein